MSEYYSHKVWVVGGPLEEGAALPCLYSNNSIEIGDQNAPPALAAEGIKTLSVQCKKSATALAWNVQHLAETFGIERLGFLTLTFADDVQDRFEAQRRFNSFASNYLRGVYVAYIRVWERCLSGRIHYHLVVVLSVDIRTGFDFAAIAAGDYKSANKHLKKHWSSLRSAARKHGFGRTELLPIRSTSEGIARYVGKYISKHMGARREEDKGARLVEYSGVSRMASTRFAFHTKGSREWRQKVRLFAHIISEQKAVPPTMAGLKRALGPRWAYQWREYIFSLPPIPFSSDINAKLSK